MLSPAAELTAGLVFLASTVGFIAWYGEGMKLFFVIAIGQAGGILIGKATEFYTAGNLFFVSQKLLKQGLQPILFLELP